MCNSVLNDNNNQSPASAPAECATNLTQLGQRNASGVSDISYAPEGIENYPSLLQPRLQPGVYMIICLINDYRYYGETSNVSHRLAGHRRDLRRKIHGNNRLQTDWNAFGEDNFEFSVLFIGEGWHLREKRLEKETELILNHPGQVYNTYAAITDRMKELNSFYDKKHSESTKALIGALQRGKPKDQLGLPVSIEGKIYPSLAEASRCLGHSRKTIRNRLQDLERERWYYLSEKPNDYPIGSRGNAVPEKASA